MNLDEFKAKGFVQNNDGTWSSPHSWRKPDPERSGPVPVARLGADAAQSTSSPPLVCSEPESQQCLEVRGQSPRYRVRMVVFRHRLVDKDAKDQLCKAATDAIAAALGYDDEDEHLTWEWEQVKTSGKQGVAVTIERLHS